MDARLYEGLGEGFGIGSPQDVLELRKALEAGYGTQPSTQTGGGALRTESLESTLKVLTFRDRHFTFWRDVPKTRAFSTVEEFAELSSYGTEGEAWNLEGVLPSEQDSTYSRKAVFTKFAGSTRQVSHPMTQIRTMVGDVIARENINGILYILREIERTCFWGNSKLGVAGAEYVEFDGLANLVTGTYTGSTPNQIDLARAPLTERTIRNAAQIVLDNYGIPTHCYASPRVMEDVAKEYIAASRVPMPTPGGNFAGGFVVDRMMTVAGEVMLRGDIFLRKNTSPGPPASARGTAPPAPAAASVTKALGSASGTNYWEKGGKTISSVVYRATYGNNRGESAPTSASAQAITAADVEKPITVTVTNPASFTTAPSFINLYRSDDGGPFGLIRRVPCTTIAGSGTTNIVDNNEIIPDTYTAFLGEMTEDVLQFRQLLDLVRMDLAIVAPAYRWMVLLYGVMTMYAPLKWTVIRNIGEAA